MLEQSLKELSPSCQVDGYHWVSGPSEGVWGVLQVVHGMAEHCLRYRELAERVCGEGIAVVAHDHPGHGRSALGGMKGHFGDENGWELALAEVRRVNQVARELYPARPICVLGHSMGSFLTMRLAMEKDVVLTSVVLSSSDYLPSWIARVARLLPIFEARLCGLRRSSVLAHALTFRKFNAAFKPNRTAYDWLAEDIGVVDRYVEDPDCGFRCTNQLWSDLLGGLEFIFNKRNQELIPSSLPFLLIGGRSDPMHHKGKKLLQLQDSLQKAGLEEVELRLLPGRHEVLNELGREQTYDLLVSWMRRHAGFCEPASDDEVQKRGPVLPQ